RSGSRYTLGVIFHDARGGLRLIFPSDSRSENELPTVLRRLDTELVEAPQHIVAHVGHDEPAAVEPRAVREQRLRVEVELDALVDEERLRDEQVGRACRVEQDLGPLGV